MQIFRVGNVTLDDGKLSSKNFVMLPQLTVAFEIFTLLARFTVNTVNSTPTTDKMYCAKSRLNVFVRSRSNWNLEVLVFEERGKPEHPEKNLSEQEREPTTISTHM